jgi:transposase
MTKDGKQPKAWHDPIVSEVRRVREELFAAAGYDIREFCRRLREKQSRSGHPVVTHEPGTPGEAT